MASSAARCVCLALAAFALSPGVLAEDEAHRAVPHTRSSKHTLLRHRGEQQQQQQQEPAEAAAPVELRSTEVLDSGAQAVAEAASSPEAPAVREPAAPKKGAQGLIDSLFDAAGEEFPFLELIGWFTNMDDEEFAALQQKTKALKAKVKDVFALVDKFSDLDKTLAKFGPIAKGITSLVRRKPGSTGDHKAARQLAREKALAAKPVPQTKEEKAREVETRTRLHRTIRVLTSWLTNSSSALLSLPVEQTIVPEVMKMRRSSSPEVRLFFDRLVGIPVDDMDKKHPEVKVAEVADVLFESGYNDWAETVNVTMPLVKLARKVMPLLSESTINGTRLASILKEVAEIPAVAASEQRQLAKAAAGGEEALKKVETARSTLVTAAKLLDAGTGRHVHAKKLLHDLGLTYAGNMAPMLADFVFMQGEMNESMVTIVNDIFEMYKAYAPDNSPFTRQLKDIFASIADIANLMQGIQTKGFDKALKDTSLGRIAGHLSESLHMVGEDKAMLEDTLQWFLLFSCSLHGVGENRAICKDYSGEGALTKFNAARAQAFGKMPATRRQPAVPLLRKPRATSTATGPALAPIEEAKVADVAALVQHSVVVARRPPFPAEQLSGWVSSHYGMKVQELEDAIEAAKAAAWFMQPANREFIGGIVRGLKNIWLGRSANSTRSNEAAAAAQKAQDQKDEAAKRRRAARKGPPPKQTPEERQREKATRASLAHDLELLLTKTLKMPAILRAPMEALLVPDVMTMRRKGDHQSRMLVDRLAGISLDDLTNATAAAKAQDAVEAFRASGYTALPKVVDFMGNKTAPLIRLAKDVREEAGKGQLSFQLTARLLRKVAPALSRGSLKPLGDGMVKLAGLVEGSGPGSDPTDARLALDAAATVTTAANLALGRANHSLQALGHQVAGLVAGMGASPSLGLPAEGLKRTSTMLHYISDFRKGNEAEMVLRGAELAEQSHVNTTIVSNVLDEAVAFVCALGGVAERIPGCPEA